MLPWVSIAARGAPAVPLVNSRAARCSGSTSVIGAGSAAMISAALTAPSISAPPAATTVRSEGTAARSHVAPRRRRAAVDDGRHRPDGGDLVGQFAGRARRVQGHGDGADAERRQVGDDEGHAVAAHDGHTVTVGDPVGQEPASGAGDESGELGVRGRPVATDDRHAVTIVAVDDVRQVHRTSACRFWKRRRYTGVTEPLLVAIGARAVGDVRAAVRGRRIPDVVRNVCDTFRMRVCGVGSLR